MYEHENDCFAFFTYMNNWSEKAFCYSTLKVAHYSAINETSLNNTKSRGMLWTSCRVTPFPH